MSIISVLLLVFLGIVISVVSFLAGGVVGVFVTLVQIENDKKLKELQDSLKKEI